MWGPFKTPSLGGTRYFIQFIDDSSKWCEVRFLKSKGEAFSATKEFITLVEKQKGKSVKAIQSDNGREYINNDFDSYLKQRGIILRLTVAHNPEQNLLLR